MTQNTDLSKERFGFTIFLSACLHIMLIAGVGFSFLEETNSAPAIEITLAQYRSDVAPDQADFIAQENQSGSGSLDTAAAPSTPIEAEFHDEVIQQVDPIPQAPAPNQQVEPTDLALLTSTTAELSIEQQLEEDAPETDNPLSEQATPEELSLAIASLQAQLDLQQQEYAKRPRKYTISSASTQKRHDALYLDSWRKRIEAVGNLNYPEQARSQEIFGSLRMLVALRPNGSVQEIRILQSSGQRVLDEAAVQIVSLAAPFDPFPPELQADVDILEIIRTWRFHRGNSFSSE
ncbi:MAG: TonB family protein [Gammaproteobacteria bacterium]|nr:TonB family protein [Gammaproteobacteria bacterium]MDP2141074.1 TonB family protein [Gammaproteobacteria bacterium]MDP2348532.1 TonB family protein [Gammaproteobacteria bacterium]